jgi:hypothetical protein
MVEFIRQLGELLRVMGQYDMHVTGGILFFAIIGLGLVGFGIGWIILILGERALDSLCGNNVHIKPQRDDTFPWER